MKKPKTKTVLTKSQLIKAIQSCPRGTTFSLEYEWKKEDDLLPFVTLTAFKWNGGNAPWYKDILASSFD